MSVSYLARNAMTVMRKYDSHRRKRFRLFDLNMSDNSYA
jgi:hypothetical protein